MHNRHKKVLLVSLFVVMVGVLLAPQPVSAYWDEYVTYTADDYLTESGEDPYTYWLHSVAVMQYRYAIIGGRWRLLGVEWYKVEHTTKMQGVGWGYWINCNLRVEMYIVRNDLTQWSSDTPWTWYHEEYPGITAQSGDMLKDRAISGGLPRMLHTTITITW